MRQKCDEYQVIFAVRLPARIDVRVDNRRRPDARHLRKSIGRESSMKTVAFASAVAAALAIVAPQAVAIERFDAINATGVCQGSLPNFEGELRKRPTGVANQGDAASFIGCSTMQNFFGVESASQLNVIFTNRTNEEMTISCTMVEGINFVGLFTPVLHPKDFVVPANESFEGSWTAADDNGGVPYFPSLNVLCSLPVGGEINTLAVYIAEDGAAPAAP
jgi:hypothetical protein